MNQNVEILDALKRQLNSFWNVSLCDDMWMLEKINEAVIKVNNSFKATNDKYYLKYGFSIYNSAHYSIFLYYLAKIIGMTKPEYSSTCCGCPEQFKQCSVKDNPDGGGVLLTKYTI